MNKQVKRVATDTAGYALLILSVLTGWLPGPGGIPLAIAGLGLLSIHNEWAARLREYLLTKGGNLVNVLFPAKTWVQITYDIVVVALFSLVVYLACTYSAVWQLTVAGILFFFALIIACMNRDRYNRLKHKLNK